MSGVQLSPPSRARLRVVYLGRAVMRLVALEVLLRCRDPLTISRRLGIDFVGFSWPEQADRRLTWDVSNKWWAVEAVLRRWPIARERLCLRRALLLGWDLRHLEPSLCLEITSLTPFSAHAWLVVGNHRLDMGEGGPFVAPHFAPGPT